MSSYLITKTIRSVQYRFFSCVIPRDLKKHFENRSKFYLSLNSVTKRQALLLCRNLNLKVRELFDEIRKGMKSLTIDDIKDILRFEIRKQVLWAHHVDEGTSQIDIRRKIESLSSVSNLEKSYLEKFAFEEKQLEMQLDKKLKKILDDNEIDSSTNTFEYKKLRRYFKELYVLRYDWARALIKRTGRGDEDFKKEADNILQMNLYSDSEVERLQVRGVENTESKIKNLKIVDTESTEDSSSLETTPLSDVIDLFIDEKNYKNEKTKNKFESFLRLLVEDFGDISINRINSAKVNLFRQHLRQLPSRRNVLAKYREKSFHELIEMSEKNQIRAEDRLDVNTINETIGFLSSFFKWTTSNGYSEKNLFQGVKIRDSQKKHSRDYRPRYSEKQISKLFNAKDFLENTIGRKNYAFYWVPLICLFSGARVNEICSLYLDNIIQRQGKNTGARFQCFNLVEEPDRPQKRLKTLSSRRILPIHDTLIELGFIEFVKLLRRDKNRERLFEELKYTSSGYANSVQKFWNERYSKRVNVSEDSQRNRTTFHSLRHTVTDLLKQANVDTKFINEHQGHSQKNIDLDRYGKAYDVEILYENCTKKIVYESSRGRRIDFSGLKVDWEKKLKYMK